MLRIRFILAVRILGSAPLAAVGAPSMAQTTGDSTVGQQLFTTTLSLQCAGCHSTTSSAAVNSLTSIRNSITSRPTPAGAAGTMSFEKALDALDRALTGTTLGNAVTGMNGLYTLTSTQRGDLAAYIAGLAGPAPSLRYSPASGPIFAATAAGASASSAVTISNVGTADLVFPTNNAVTIATGGDAADFRVTASTCTGATLQPYTGNCTVNVTFTPAAGVPLTRTASIGLTTATGTVLVPMAGTVVAAAPAPTGSAANAPSSGGGGAMPWPLVLLAAAVMVALPARRSRTLNDERSPRPDGCRLAGVGTRYSRDRRNSPSRGLLFWSANPPDDRDALMKCSTKEIS